MLDHLRFWARAWQGLRRSSALADYGEIENLLECVSSYTHEVASFNAANVWNLRVTADVLEVARRRRRRARAARRGRRARRRGARAVPARRGLLRGAPARRVEAAGAALLRLQHRRHDDRRKTSTRPPAPEMVAFFQRELQTPEWLRALSPWDPDASYSVRPDHQWNGAYTAWPADAARALVALGEPKVALDWLPGLARTANQGPPAQAHFVEEAQPLINGGARKAPPQLPYINDWACSSAGAYVALVIESLFGAAPGIDGLGEVDGLRRRLDPSAVLRGLRVGDRLVDVHADGRVDRPRMTDGRAARRRPRAASRCAAPSRSSARDRGLRPHRLPAWARAQVPDAFMAQTSAESAGVRLAFRTAATTIELDVSARRMAPDEASDAAAESLRAHGGRRRRRGGARCRRVALPLHLRGPVGPRGRRTAVDRALRGPAGGGERSTSSGCRSPTRSSSSPCAPTLRSRRPPTGMPSAGSITAARSATAIARSPRRARGRSSPRSPPMSTLTNLAFSGSAMLDPFTARTMRDQPADLISLKVGINLVNGDAMRMRAFRPAVDGFLDTIREGHPSTPIVVVSPICCEPVERAAGPTMQDPARPYEWSIAGGTEAEVAMGKLSLERDPRRARRDRRAPTRDGPEPPLRRRSAPLRRRRRRADAAARQPPSWSRRAAPDRRTVRRSGAAAVRRGCRPDRSKRLPAGLGGCTRNTSRMIQPTSGIQPMNHHPPDRFVSCRRRQLSASQG